MFSEKISTLAEVVNSLQKIVTDELTHNPNNTGLEKEKEILFRLSEQCTKYAFQVAVIALAKSGKSTFINAILGGEYLPSSNVPETARIVRITHNPKYPDGHLSDKSDKNIVIEGEEKIRKHLTIMNSSARSDNKQPSEDELRLQAPIKALSEKDFSGVTFEILDTPGPNEAGADKLKTKVNTLLEEADVIIYLLDYTKLKTDYEAQIVTDMSNRPDLFKTNRLFFVVNKIDEQDRNGLSPTEVVDYVFNFLQEKIINEEKKPLFVDKGKIFTVSARKALVARLVQKPNAPDGVIADYTKSFAEFGENVPLNELLQYAPGRLKASNLTFIEDNILTFVYNNREKILLDSLTEGITNAITLLSNHLLLAKKANETSESDLKLKITEIKNEISVLDSSLINLNHEAKKFEKKIINWIDIQFQETKEEFESLIDSIFTGGANQTETEKKGFVEEAINMAKKAFASLIGHQDDATMRNALNNAMMSMMGLFDNLFLEFRRKLEEEGRDKQQELLANFTKIISKCSDTIEKKIGTTFDITLQPIVVHVEKLDVSDMNSKVNTFIKEHQHTQPRTVSTGWCSSGTVYDTTYTYSLDKNEVKKAWVTKINDLFEGSKKTADAFIKGTIIDVVNTAKTDFTRYANGYVQVMNGEVLGKSKGDVEIKQRNQKLTELLVEISNISSKLK